MFFSRPARGRDYSNWTASQDFWRCDTHRYLEQGMDEESFESGTFEWRQTNTSNFVGDGFRAPWRVLCPQCLILLDPLESESIRRLSRNLILTYCATRKRNLSQIAGCTAAVRRGRGIENPVKRESLDPPWWIWRERQSGLWTIRLNLSWIDFDRPEGETWIAGAGVVNHDAKLFFAWRSNLQLAMIWWVEFGDIDPNVFSCRELDASYMESSSHSTVPDIHK